MTTHKTTQIVSLDEAFALSKTIKNFGNDFKDSLSDMLKCLYELDNPGYNVAVNTMGTDFAYQINLELEEGKY